MVGKHRNIKMKKAFNQSTELPQCNEKGMEKKPGRCSPSLAKANQFMDQQMAVIYESPFLWERGQARYYQN